MADGVLQVLNAGWDVDLPVTSQNGFPCLNRVSYNKVLDHAKPMNDPDGRHFSSFTYLRLSPVLMERQNFIEFERFVKRMHGKMIMKNFKCMFTLFLIYGNIYIEERKLYLYMTFLDESSCVIWKLSTS